MARRLWLMGDLAVVWLIRDEWCSRTVWILGALSNSFSASVSLLKSKAREQSLFS